MNDDSNALEWRVKQFKGMRLHGAARNQHTIACFLVEDLWEEIRWLRTPLQCIECGGDLFAKCVNCGLEQ